MGRIGDQIDLGGHALRDLSEEAIEHVDHAADLDGDRAADWGKLVA